MKNPFNYYKAYHYLYETGDLMIDNMTGKQKTKDFGEYLTMDNVAAHIEKRKAQYQEIKDYYMANGQLPYQGYDDASNYMANEKDNFTDMKDIK